MLMHFWHCGCKNNTFAISMNFPNLFENCNDRILQYEGLSFKITPFLTI